MLALLLLWHFAADKHLNYSVFNQVFELQVNNGIPIESWYSNPLDEALPQLIPFLETLAVADDVRPIIAKKFGNIIDNR
jgi:CTD small phosphatase-like protein 2